MHENRQNRGGAELLVHRTRTHTKKTTRRKMQQAHHVLSLAVLLPCADSVSRCVSIVHTVTVLHILCVVLNCKKTLFPSTDSPLVAVHACRFVLIRTCGMHVHIKFKRDAASHHKRPDDRPDPDPTAVVLYALSVRAHHTTYARTTELIGLECRSTMYAHASQAQATWRVRAVRYAAWCFGINRWGANDGDGDGV